MSKSEKKGLVPALRFPEFQNAGEWKKIRLIDLAINGLSNGVFNDPKKVGCGYKLVNVLDMYLETTINEASLSLIDIGLIEFEKNKVEYGDVFFTRSSLVKAGIAHSNIYLGSSNNITFDGHLIRLRPNQSIIKPIFLHYVLKTQHTRTQLIAKGKSATMTTIGQADIASTTVFKPKLEEQQKIADCLSSTDDLITAETQKLAALKTYKKGLMQQLFPAEGETVPRLRFPEFWDAGEWESQKLEGLAKRGSGHTPNKAESSYYNGGIKWVSLADSNKLDNGYIYETKIQISNNGLKNSSAVLHPSGTVIVSRDAGVGKSAILHSEMAVSQHFIVWICDQSKLLNWFLYYILQILKPTFEAIAVGSTIKTIGLPYFKELCIFIPSVEEQQKIADCLSSVDELITAQSEKIEALKLHKKGLMQQLFPVMDNHPTPSGHPSTGGELRQRHSPPVEGWQAQPDGVVSPTTEGN